MATEGAARVVVGLDGSAESIAAFTGMLVGSAESIAAFTGMLVGSVSIHCVTSASCPVVVVRGS
jgi:hypothetical protein